MGEFSHEERVSGSFHATLLVIDTLAAQALRARGCPYCVAGPLHAANWPRKVRGLGEASERAGQYDTRLGLCCGREGCRRRTTPPSVRFGGRRVYAFVVFVLASAAMNEASESATGGRMDISDFRVPVSTLSRWSRFWRTDFAHHPWFVQLSACMESPLDKTRLPRALLERFSASRYSALESTLRLIAPWTTATAAFEISRVVMAR